LEQLVEGGKPRIAGRVMIDEEAFYVQTSRLRKALPDIIKQASDIVKKREDLLGNAEGDANRMLTDAQEEAQRLRSDARSQADRMVANAREDQERIVEEGRREAERIEADAREHAEQLVAENTIMQRAQQAADEMHRQAVEESDELRQQAGQWSMARLQQLESVLNRLHDSVEEGKQQLAAEVNHRSSNGRDLAPAQSSARELNGHEIAVHDQ
jgi:cell division septum initiation protein DivIVA